MTRLLLVEDNLELATWLARTLRRESYTVDVVHDAEGGLERLGLETYGLMILDLSLPGLSGMAMLKRLRASGNRLPILILTALASLDGRVAGLDAGADDYMAKPFEVAELVARVRAHIRRSANRPEPVLALGPLELDTNARLFRLHGQPLGLPLREFAILEQLALKAGRTVSKEFLIQSVFSLDDEAVPSTVEIYVSRLRKRLEGTGLRIVTFRGIGYLLDVPQEAAP